MLAKRWSEKGDIDAAHKLVTSHLRLVAKIAMGFKGYGLPVLEIISEGNIGLMQAIKKFDPEKGFRLSTYAMWWIKASIQEYILKSWSLVKIGTTTAQKKLFFNLKRIKGKLDKVDNTNLSPNDVSYIANELNVSEKEVISMDSRISYSDQSLNDPISNNMDESGEYIDFLQDDSESHEDLFVNIQDYTQKRELFTKAFSELKEREKFIITQRKLSENPLTLDDLSKHYNISRERVRQIEARALEKLEKFVKNKI
jgi:RNA polymerase sigma-32 factor